MNGAWSLGLVVGIWGLDLLLLLGVLYASLEVGDLIRRRFM